MPQPLALHFFGFISGPFVAGLWCVLLAWPLTAKAQQTQPALRTLAPMLGALIWS